MIKCTNETYRKTDLWRETETVSKLTVNIPQGKGWQKLPLTSLFLFPLSCGWWNRGTRVRRWCSATWWRTRVPTEGHPMQTSSTIFTSTLSACCSDTHTHTKQINKLKKKEVLFDFIALNWIILSCAVQAWRHFERRFILFVWMYLTTAVETCVWLTLKCIVGDLFLFCVTF